MTTLELYSYEARLLGLKEMIRCELQRFLDRPITAARLADLKLTAARITEKLDAENLPMEAMGDFEEFSASLMERIFKPKPEETE
jgi:hypothetical protein